MNDTLQKAIDHYDRHVIGDDNEPANARQRQELQTAAAYSEAGMELGDDERALLKKAVQSYIGHLSRGGYSGGVQPTTDEVEAAHQALAELERPRVYDIDQAYAGQSAPQSEAGIER
jgi:hypothetical protein